MRLTRVSHLIKNDLIRLIRCRRDTLDVMVLLLGRWIASAERHYRLPRSHSHIDCEGGARMIAKCCAVPRCGYRMQQAHKVYVYACVLPRRVRSKQHARVYCDQCWLDGRFARRLSVAVGCGMRGPPRGLCQLA